MNPVLQGRWKQLLSTVTIRPRGQLMTADGQAILGLLVAKNRGDGGAPSGENAGLFKKRDALSRLCHNFLTHDSVDVFLLSLLQVFFLFFKFSSS